MKLIARRGESTYLIKDGDRGVVVDTDDRVQYEPQPIAAILKQGYWAAEDGTREFVDALLSIPRIGGKAIGKPQESKTKSVLAASHRFLAATAKSATEGVWRTIEGDQKVFIKDGKVHAGGPSGKVVAGKPEKRPAKKRAPRPKDGRMQPAKKVGIVDGSSKPPAGLSRQEIKTAIDAARTASRGWEKKLTRREMESVQSWTDVFYRDFRRQIASGSQGKEASEFLSALEKAPPIEASVYRGMQIAEEKIEGFKAMLNAIGVGGTWEDAAPFSTSLEPMIAAGFMGGYKSGVMMKIKTKTGRYIENASGNSEEFEVVSMPGAKYKITAIETGRQVNINLGMNAEPKLYIEMEEIE